MGYSNSAHNPQIEQSHELTENIDYITSNPGHSKLPAIHCL